jgi:hypothetical protein
MDADPMSSSQTGVPDGWALLIDGLRDRVKPATYDLRMSDGATAALYSAGVQPNDAFALDWRKVDGQESYLVLVVTGRLLTVDPSTRQAVPASQDAAKRASPEIAYVNRLLKGPLMTEESSVLTQWIRESADPLPRRLQRELMARHIAPTDFAVADAFVRNIDEVLFLGLSDTSGALQLTYDFSVGLTEDAGVIRDWHVLNPNEREAFSREFLVAAQLLSRPS